MDTVDILAEVLAETYGQPAALMREQLCKLALPHLSDRGTGFVQPLTEKRIEELRAICRTERASILLWMHTMGLGQTIGPRQRI